jgi:hypothetical protein
MMASRLIHPRRREKEERGKPMSAQEKREHAYEYLYRVVDGLRSSEHGAILGQLESVAAILDYFAVCENYDALSLGGIDSAIAAGASPAPFRKFVRKYGLPWTC